MFHTTLIEILPAPRYDGWYRGRAEHDLMTVKHIYIAFIIPPLLSWPPLHCLEHRGLMQTCRLCLRSTARGPAGEIKKDVAPQSEHKFISDQLGWSWKTRWDWNITQLPPVTCSLSGNKGQVECCQDRNWNTSLDGVPRSVLLLEYLFMTSENFNRDCENL